MTHGLGLTETSSSTIESIDENYNVITDRLSTIPTVSSSSDFGRPIPTEAQMDCVDLMVEEWGAAPLLAEQAVREAAGLLEHDRPDSAIRTLMLVVDLCGAYRLISMMAVAAPCPERKDQHVSA